MGSSPRLEPMEPVALLHCTLALTVAAALSVNVQVATLLPLLEHAPDQMALRPFETPRVIAVPVAKVDEALLPTSTLTPAGADVMRSPLRPLAVTVSVAGCRGGLTVKVAVRVTPPYAAESVTAVDVLTEVVVTENGALVAPAGMVTLAGTLAMPGLLTESATTAPP